MILGACQQNRSRFRQNVLSGEAHCELRLIAQPIGQAPGELGIDMLHDDNGRREIRRELRKHFGQGSRAAGRRADEH